MKKLRINLLLFLIAFALILVAVMSYVNRQILIADIKEQESIQHTLIENHILTDMHSVDNAHLYFDKSISERMEKELKELVEYYTENPDIFSWDLEALKREHGMDIYILDKTNTVVATTFLSDVGLNFSQCCKKFSVLLDERRISGEFFTDGIDVSMTTGKTRKYSYLATPDKKYLLELGFNLNEVPIFETFNFGKTADYLVEKYADLLEIKTINAGGVFLDDSQDTSISVKDQSQVFQKYYYLAKKTKLPTEYKKEFENGYIETVRFLPYEAETSRGESTNRIVYVKYGNKTELEALAKNTKQFWVLLNIALITSVGMLTVINRLLSKTIKMATYDPLTGAFNRATYISKMNNVLKKRKHNIPGLLLVDLDNFKQVNDQYGHLEGDKVLVKTAKVLKQVVKKNGFVVRFGGDEFAIVLYDANEEYLKKIADDILERIRRLKNEQTEMESWSILSVSLGGAFYEKENETEMSLFERADQALYQSKNAGKNRYSSFDEVAADIYR